MFYKYELSHNKAAVLGGLVGFAFNGDWGNVLKLKGSLYGREGNGEFMFYGYRVSVGEDESALDMEDGDG